MDNANKRSVILWLPAKEGVTQDGRPYKLYNGSVNLGDGQSFDVSGFENVSKDGTKQYIKLYEKEQKIKTEEPKKEF